MKKFLAVLSLTFALSFPCFAGHTVPGNLYCDCGTPSCVCDEDGSRTSRSATSNRMFADSEPDELEINPFRWLIQLCAQEHPGISIDRGIFGGIPHLREIRLAVGVILAQLYVLGSVQAVVEYYAPDISEEQIKEAIAFAQDFLEMACDPHQTHD